jgi:hypothetical protein
VGSHQRTTFFASTAAQFAYYRTTSPHDERAAAECGWHPFINERLSLQGSHSLSDRQPLINATAPNLTDVGFPDSARTRRSSSTAPPGPAAYITYARHTQK